MRQILGRFCILGLIVVGPAVSVKGEPFIPLSLLPPDSQEYICFYFKALAASDVVMMLRIQAERLAGLHLDLEDYKNRYQANSERMAKYAPKALLMHPGPIIRGLELTSEVADGPQSLIAEQVRHGVAVRMALLARALGPGRDKTR